MTKVVVIGLKGESGLWAADLDAGTIVPIPEPLKGDMAAIAPWRANGTAIIKGVDVAVAIMTAAETAGGLHEGGLHEGGLHEGGLHEGGLHEG